MPEMPSNTKIPSRQEMKEALICRVGNEITKKLNDATVAVMGLGGLVSARVMGCAAHQALTVLKILIDDISGDL